MQLFSKHFFFFFYLLLFVTFSILFSFFTYQLIIKTASFSLLGFDFRALYTAVVMLNNGVHGSFYNLSTQFFWQNSIFNLPSKTDLMPFLNPPFLALFFLPLAKFPISIAYVFFSSINIFLAIVAFYFLVFPIGKKSVAQTITLFGFFFFYFPVLITLLQGQWSFLLLLGLIFASHLFSKNKKILAGVSLSLLLIRPHLLFIPVLLFFVKQQWRMLSGLGFGVFVFTLISYAIVGFTGLNAYARLLLLIPFWGNKLTVHPFLEPTLRGFLQSLFHTSFILPILPIFIFGVLLTLFLVKKSLLSFNFAALIIVILFTSIHTNYHDLVLLLLPCVFIIKSIKRIPFMLFTAFSISILVNLSYFRPELSILLFIFILMFYLDHKPWFLRK